jgi:hypothetical protein
MQYPGQISSHRFVRLSLKRGERRKLQTVPIDPRLIRSVGIEIYLGAIRDSDFGTGMVAVGPDGGRRSIIRTVDDNGFPIPDSMILSGLVDTWAADHGDRGSRIRMQGRDLRGMFLDSPIDPKVLGEINLQRPIDDVIISVLEKHPAGGRIIVDSNPDDWPNGEIPTALGVDDCARVRRKASGQNAKSTPPGKNLNYWDVITHYCTLVGAVPSFLGSKVSGFYTLLIRPARSLFDQSKKFLDPQFNSPFRSRSGTPAPRGAGADTFTVRKMVYGQNVQRVSFERKFTGTKSPVIEVVSFDTSSKEKGEAKLIKVQWPAPDKKAARVTGVAPSGQSSQTDKIVISRPGCRSKDQLLEIAKNLYEEIGRGELGGSCETKDLASFAGDNDDPDLLRLRPGDAVEFIVDTRGLSSKAPLVAELVDHERRSFAEQAQALRQALRGKSGAVDENLVQILVASARSSIVNLLRTFRTTNVKYRWTTESLNISFDFQNYFIVRQPTEELGANTAPIRRKTSTAQKRPKSRIIPDPVIAPAPRKQRDRERRPTRSGGGTFGL